METVFVSGDTSICENKEILNTDVYYILNIVKTNENYAIKKMLLCDTLAVSKDWSSDPFERLLIVVAQFFKKKIIFRKTLKEFNYHIECKSVKLCEL